MPMFYLNFLTVKFIVQKHQITYNHSQQRELPKSGPRKLCLCKTQLGSSSQTQNGLKLVIIMYSISCFLSPTPSSYQTLKLSVLPHLHFIFPFQSLNNDKLGK